MPALTCDRSAVLRALPGALLLVALTTAAQAQEPQVPTRLTPAQIEQLRRNPELIRERIAQSGLTPDQVRAQLRAAGYPENILDAYLEDEVGGGRVPEPLPAELSAVEALALPFVISERALPADTGFVTRSFLPSRVFGVDVFRRTSTQFLPTLAGPVPPDYVLGPGDVLVLIITGDVELTHTLTVAREGFILIPQVGQVSVANLTLGQLRDVLYTRLSRVYSGIRRNRGVGAATRFDVSVANVRVTQVFVTGEVLQPGTYRLSALGSALTAIYAAGGVTDRAGLRRIEVRRNDETVATLDLYDYLLRGDTRNDVRLATGDVVFVPIQHTRVEVAGAVVRPALYEVSDGENLADVLAAAGGFRADADLRRLTVYRIVPRAQQGPGAAQRAAISVELLANGQANGSANRGHGVAVPEITVHDGDSIVVHELPPLEEGYFVRIAGMVRRPGMFPWREGMTLRDLMLLAGGPSVGADLREAEIARMPADRTGGQLADVVRIPMDSSYIANRDTAGRYVGPPGPPFDPPGTAPEFELAPFDQVLVLKQPAFELQREVTVTGQVLVPGTYTLTRKDERLSGLVQRAGGFLPTAYPEGARFIRSLNEAGRVNVDLAAAVQSPGGRGDIVLQPGDSLDIPEFIPTVRVEGAVNAPTSVLYRDGEGLDYYVGNAGGYTRNADKGRVSVRFANGSARVKSRFLFFSSSPTPRPGSTVFVPEKEPGSPFNVTQFVAAVAQILASTVAIIVVATR